MRFKHALVKTPAPSMVDGISHAGLGLPDYDLALEQHSQYIDALQRCDVAVTVLPADAAYPDACFVEDPAILTPDCAIITRPGATSRRGETASIAAAVGAFYQHIECIEAPGTLDGGDVMMVGGHFYVGLSDRTNQEGADQLLQLLQAHGMSGTTIPLQQVLHLKTGLSYLEHNNLLISGEFTAMDTFKGFNQLQVPVAEAYAANCIWVNERVLVPAGFPRTASMIEQLGYAVMTVDVSEFEKLDGGLSCLSLRF